MSKIEVEVAYAANSEKQWLLPVTVAANSSVLNAIIASNIMQLAGIQSLAAVKVGIFSELCNLNTTVNHGDRIEIYRPLLIDPKEKRRKRASSRST